MPCADNELKNGKLLIKYKSGDTIEGRPIEPCTNFWSSPDLWVEGGPNDGTAQEGVPHDIKARVTNGTGQAIEDVDVEAWVCDYTAGPLPNGQLNPPGRLIGFQAQIPANGSRVVTLAPQWTPTPTQVALNGGHLCLAANAYSLTEPDGAELPSGNNLKICCDTHHAQRNIALVAVQKMMMAQVPMAMHAGPDGKRRRWLIEIQPVPGKVGFRAAEKRMIRSAHLPFKKVTVSRRRPRGFFIDGKGIEPGREVVLDIEGKKPARLTLNVPVGPNEKPGTLQLFNVTTRDAENPGEPVGGARLMVLAL